MRGGINVYLAGPGTLADRAKAHFPRMRVAGIIVGAGAIWGAMLVDGGPLKAMTVSRLQGQAHALAPEPGLG